eukprot:gene12218-biopygen398
MLFFPREVGARWPVLSSVCPSVCASNERFSGLADAFSAPEWRSRVSQRTCCPHRLKTRFGHPARLEGATKQGPGTESQHPSPQENTEQHCGVPWGPNRVLSDPGSKFWKLGTAIPARKTRPRARWNAFGRI